MDFSEQGPLHRHGGDPVLRQRHVATRTPAYAEGAGLGEPAPKDELARPRELFGGRDEEHRRWQHLVDAEDPE